MQTESNTLPVEFPKTLPIHYHAIVQDVLDNLNSGKKLSYGQIAKRHNISRPGAQYIMTRPEIKAITTGAQSHYTLLFPLVSARFQQLLEKTDITNADLLKTIQEYHKTMGVGQAHTLLQFNLYGDSKDGIDPKLRQIMSRIGATQEDIPDGEVINIE